MSPSVILPSWLVSKESTCFWSAVRDPELGALEASGGETSGVHFTAFLTFSITFSVVCLVFPTA